MLYSSVTIGNFFFPSSYHICDQFLWTCPQKNICIANGLLLLKKDLKIKAERKRNHWRQKRVVFQKTFWTSPRKTRKFRRYCILSLFGQWNQSKEFSNQLLLRESKVHPSTNFLFVCWLGKLEVLFFVEEMFRVSFVFSCLWKNASNCIAARQKNEGKSNNETNFVWAKK